MELLKTIFKQEQETTRNQIKTIYEMETANTKVINNYLKLYKEL